MKCSIIFEVIARQESFCHCFQKYLGLLDRWIDQSSTKERKGVKSFGRVVAFDQDTGDENDNKDEDQQRDDFGEEVKVALRFDIILGGQSIVRGG